MHLGARLVELLKQDQYQPMFVEHQIFSIYAGVNGYLNDLDADQVLAFETAFLQYMDTQHSDIGKEIRVTGKLDEKSLKAAIEDFLKTYQP